MPHNTGLNMKTFWNASSMVLAATLVATGAGTTATPAHAQTAPAADTAAPRAEDIIVTATRREEKLNRVPAAIEALSGKQLDQLNIQNFEKLVEYIPEIRTASRGPGVSSIYIRGLSTDTAGSQILGVSGQQPTVALYLNDAPASTPGRNLDIHPTDLNRVEVLAGPQGTLFGASAMGGAIRYITNKPDLSEFHAGFTGTASTTKHGNGSYSFEGYVNIPIIKDTLAVRLVGYNDSQGGYIDNVPGTYQMPWNPTGGANGIPSGNPLLVAQAIQSCNGIVGCVATATGTQSGTGVKTAFIVPTFQSISNTAFVAPHYNDANYAGGRAEVTWRIDPDWSIEGMIMHQALKTDGVFDYAPGVGDLQVQQYGNNTLRDTIDLETVTLKGRLSILDMIYTSSFLNHHSVQQSDYAKYDNIGLFVPYYNCDQGIYYNSGYYGNKNGHTCYSPANSYKVDDTNRRWTQEFRVTTPADKPLRGTFGVFYDVNRVYDDTQWNYTLPAAGFIYSLTPNPQTNVLGLGAQPVGTGFVNDILRRDRQFSVYGEVSYDIIPKTLTATFGGRYYNEQASLTGGSNTSFHCNTAANPASNNVSCRGIYNPATGTYTASATPPAYFGASSILSQSLAGIDPTTYSGGIFKGNLTYKITPDQLVYATYSEGYRPGGFNRKGCNSAAGTGPFSAAQCSANRAYAPDKAKNYEIGAKLGLFEHKLQVNLAAYIINWTNIQMSVFDQNISNQTFITNLANARIHGLEGDITARPTHGLTLGLAFSYNDSKLYSDNLPALGNQVLVPLGSPLALDPRFQGNVHARYEWEERSGLKPYVQAGVHWVGGTISSDVSNTSVLYAGCGSYSPYPGCNPTPAYNGAPAAPAASSVINGHLVNAGDVVTPIQQSYNQPGYTTFSAAIGASRDGWSVELYGENLGDARPQLFTSGNDGETRVTTSRPRTFGVRVSVKM